MLSHPSASPTNNELSFCALYAPDSEDHNQALWLSGSRCGRGFSIENKRFLSQILLDHSGHYWLAEQTMSRTAPKLCVFNEEGQLLKNISMPGDLSLFQFGDSVFVGCEGKDGKARIYQFCKKSLGRIRDWTVDGFLWGIEKQGDLLYAACYLADENLAVLYVLGEDQQAAVELGENFFPTDLSALGDRLYVTACPVTGCNGKRVIQLDESFGAVEEFSLSTSPRQIYVFGPELVIHALELGEDQKDKLISLNVQTGEQKEHDVPFNHKMKKDGDQLFLADLEKGSIFHWDPYQQEIIKVTQLPDCQNHVILDFHFVP